MNDGAFLLWGKRRDSAFCISVIMFVYFKQSERSAARLAHYLGVVGVAGSNPAVPTLESPE